MARTKAPSGTTAERLAAAAAAHRAGSSWREIAVWYGWRSARAAEEEVRVRLAPQEWQRRRGPLGGPLSRPAWRTMRVPTPVYLRVRALAAAAGASIAACVEEALLNWLDYEEQRAGAAADAPGAAAGRTPTTGVPAGGDVSPTNTAGLAREIISEEGEA